MKLELGETALIIVVLAVLLYLYLRERQRQGQQANYFERNAQGQLTIPNLGVTLNYKGSMN